MAQSIFGFQRHQVLRQVVLHAADGTYTEVPAICRMLNMPLLEVLSYLQHGKRMSIESTCASKNDRRGKRRISKCVNCMLSVILDSESTVNVRSKLCQPTGSLFFKDTSLLREEEALMSLYRLDSAHGGQETSQKTVKKCIFH